MFALQQPIRSTFLKSGVYASLNALFIVGFTSILVSILDKVYIMWRNVINWLSIKEFLVIDIWQAIFKKSGQMTQWIR